MITVFGQKGRGRVRQRTVTPREFFDAWGPFAMLLWKQAHKVRLVVHE